jgi:hypothetical protein
MANVADLVAHPLAVSTRERCARQARWLFHENLHATPRGSRDRYAFHDEGVKVIRGAREVFLTSD